MRWRFMSAKYSFASFEVEVPRPTTTQRADVRHLPRKRHSGVRRKKRRPQRGIIGTHDGGLPRISDVLFLAVAITWPQLCAPNRRKFYPGTCEIFSKVTIGKVSEASYVFPKRNALIFSRKLRKNVTPRFNSHDGIKRNWEYGSRRTDF